MWGDFCDTFSPDVEKHIIVDYSYNNSQDGYSHARFRNYEELGEWVYNNYKNITIWEIKYDRR